MHVDIHKYDMINNKLMVYIYANLLSHDKPYDLWVASYMQGIIRAGDLA